MDCMKARFGKYDFIYSQASFTSPSTFEIRYLKYRKHSMVNKSVIKSVWASIRIL